MDRSDVICDIRGREYEKRYMVPRGAIFGPWVMNNSVLPDNGILVVRFPERHDGDTKGIRLCRGLDEEPSVVVEMF